MNLDGLLASFGDEAPSGDDLEYDPDFSALLLAAQPGEERQAGDEILPGEEPNYKDVVAKAIGILERSHDLRAGVILANAQLRISGIEGFAEATTYLRRCLEEFWDSCHPQLDADDDNDPTMRVNAVLGLADPATIEKALKSTPFVESVVGRVSLRDLSIASGEITAPEDMAQVPDDAFIAAVFRGAQPDYLRERLELVKSAIADLQGIDRVFAEHTPGQGPDLDSLLRHLRRMQTRLADAVGEPEEGGEGAADGDAGGAAASGASARAAGGVPGAITSPRDVQAALDRIIAYYETEEPSSPLPIILKRARRLVGADFLTIIRDIAPSGMDNVQLVGGIEAEE